MERTRTRRRASGWALALATLAIAGCTTAVSDEESAVRDVLKMNFSGWQPVTARDLAPEQQSTWSAQHPGGSPGFTSGDYFGDKRKAYAAVLMRKDKAGTRARLVVLAGTSSGRYESFVLFSEGPIKSLPVVYSSKPGEYQVFLYGKSLPVPTAAIVYSHGKGQEKLFFWNVDRFQDIELGS